jgi:hypothetical protein
MRVHRQYKIVDPLRLMWRRLFTLILIMLTGMALWAVWGLYNKEKESAALRAQAETKMRALEERFEELSVKTDALVSDRGKEAVLRDTYDVGKPGEGLIVIVENQASGSTSTAPSARAWWQLW